MRFADIIGQTEIKAMLCKSVDDGRISHAQLFTGDCGWGVLPFAVAYAQYINCQNRADGDSCGECPSCIKITENVHPDLHFAFPVITPKGWSTSSPRPTSDYFLPQWRTIAGDTNLYFDEQMWYEAMGVESQQGLIAKKEADEIIRKLSFKSFEGEYKIVIIWLPEKMNDSAANTLLKILEEPWDKTLFLLVSQQPEKLLPTIISRTQEVSLGRIAESDLTQHTISSGVQNEKAVVAAHLADGSLLELQRVLSEEYQENENDNFKYFTQLMRLSYNDKHLELIEWAENMATLGRESQKYFLDYTIGMLREAYVMNVGVGGINYIWGEEKQFCDNFYPFIGNHNIEQLVKEIESAIVHISHNGNAKIVFTHFALSLSKQIVKKQ